MDTNFRMNAKKINPNILTNYFSLVDKKYKVDHLEHSNNIFFAVKDYDSYSEKLQEIENSDITIREGLIARKNLINTHLPNAQTLNNQSFHPMIEHIKNILKYSRVTN